MTTPAPVAGDEDLLTELWSDACKQYTDATDISPLDTTFPKLDRLGDLHAQLEAEEKIFSEFRNRNRRLFRAIQNIVAPFEQFGSLVGDIVAPTFPPAPSIMGAILLLVQAGRGVSVALDSVMDLFDNLSLFTRRLDMYEKVSLTTGMKEIIVRVLAVVLKVCGFSRKLVRQGILKGRLFKWVKNIFSGNDEIQGCLNTLKDLTSDEHKMASAQTLWEVSEARKENHKTLLELAEMKETMLSDRNQANLMHKEERDRDVLERVKRLLQPLSTSARAYSDILNDTMLGSCQWLDRSSEFIAWWAGHKPLLWIHGGPGVGKSFLASKIIGKLLERQDTKSVESSSEIAGYFFCRISDESSRYLTAILKTIAWQVAVKAPEFADIVDKWTLTQDVDDSRSLWQDLLVPFFTTATPGQAIWIVLDGLDEAFAIEQEKLLKCLAQIYVGSRRTTLPRIHVVLISRDSLRGPLLEHSLTSVPEIDVASNKTGRDVSRYVSQRLEKAPVFKHPAKFRVEMVERLCQKADGLWVWARLAVDALLTCRSRSRAQQVLQDMPKGIPNMLQHELVRLSKEIRSSEELVQHLTIILAWVTCARQPLTLRQLKQALEVVCGEPIFGLYEDIKIRYSSILTLASDETDLADSGTTEDSGVEEHSNRASFNFAGTEDSKNDVSEPKNEIIDSKLTEQRSSENRFLDETTRLQSGGTGALTTKNQEDMTTDNGSAVTDEGSSTSDEESATTDREETSPEVVLRHASFYEFFQTSPKADDIELDMDATEIEMCKVLLTVICNPTPATAKLCAYGLEFVLSHLERVSPSKVTKHDELTISRNLAAFFASPKIVFNWTLVEEELLPFGGAGWYSSSKTSRKLDDWLYGGKHSESRAAVMLKWIEPSLAETALEDEGEDDEGEDGGSRDLNLGNCQTLWRKALGREARAFEKLFTPISTIFADRWLNLGGALTQDGRPKAFSEMLCLYAKLINDPEYVPRLVAGVKPWPKALPTAAEIVQCAEAAGFPKTAMWHARVAQALSLHGYDEEAVDHYLLSLDNGVEPSWVAHAGAASAFSNLGKHREALDHTRRSNHARKVQGTSPKTSLEEVELALRTALAEEAAGLSQRAVQSAKQALIMWDKAGEDRGDSYSSLLGIFVRNGRREESMWVMKYLFEALASPRSGEVLAVVLLPKMWYSAFCLCPEVEAKAMEIWDQSLEEALTRQVASWGGDWQFTHRYYAGLFFLRNWQTNKAINIWELVLSPPAASVEYTNGDLRDLMDLRNCVQIRLATLYLNSLRAHELEGTELVTSQHHLFDTGRSGPPKDDILRLIEEPVDSGVNLVVTSWCHLHGHGNKARDLLRGRVQKCVELLSDDDPSNDIEAYVMLFTTFLTMRNRDANVAEALYLMKSWKYQPSPNPFGAQHEKIGLDERRDEEPNIELMRNNKGADATDKEPSVDDKTYKLVNLSQTQSALVTDTTMSNNAAIDLPDLDFQSHDITQVCENCQIHRYTWSGWYFCRFCPMVQLCAECFNLLRSGDWKQQICDPGHDFFFTGHPLRVEEMVPSGKVPVGDEVIWIEEWKDRLKEEWMTEEFVEDEHGTLVKEMLHEIGTMGSSVDATFSLNDNDT